MRRGGQGFGLDNTGAATSRPLERPKGLLRTVFVGGRAYEVADDPVTAPLR